MKLRAAYAAYEAQVQTDPQAALAGLVAIAKALPWYAPARFRIVDALVTLGEIDAAAKLLINLALGFAATGQPTQAIVACKLLESMGRDAEPTVAEIAMIYAGLHGHELVPTGMPAELPDIEAPPPMPIAVEDTPLLGKIEGAQPERYPALPLLSRLRPQDFIVVLRAMKLHRVGKGARIVSQGAQGASCFLVGEGSLAVSREVGMHDKIIGKLYPGTIFGEMALVSRRPRNASITSIGSSTLLELTKATLVAHGDAMRDALYVFMRKRLLENLSLTSPLLQPLSRQARQEVISLFGSLPIRPGQSIVREGDPGQGLYVVLRGSVRVTRYKDGLNVDLATLHEGDLFGEISLLRDTPTTASVTGEEEGEVLFLDKGDFNALQSRFPEVRHALAELTEERLRTAELILENVDDGELTAII